MSPRSRESSNSILSRFRQNLWVEGLQIWTCLWMILGPVPSGRSSWSDTDSDGQIDAWIDPQNQAVTSLVDMNNVSSDADSDGATNDEEAVVGSDPYLYDSDYDGINDGDEVHLTNTSPVNWDSDGDFVSDYDELHGFSGISYSGGLPGYPGASYSDYDGDGFKNPVDPAPNDPDNYSSTNSITWGATALQDADGDGTANFFDPVPYAFIDADGDGISDDLDPFPQDDANYSSLNLVNWYGDVFGDADQDGILNWADDTPYLPPPDNDGDGLDAVQEQNYGTSDSDVDSDDDGLTDYEELIVFQTNPLNAYSRSVSLGWGELYTDHALVDLTDTDTDGIPDRIEVFYGLNPQHSADGPGDLDGNGTSNFDQYQAGIALNANLSQYDADGDGMTDAFEVTYGLQPSNAMDAMEDPDNDGVLNVEEARLMLDPTHPDTRTRGWLGDLLVLMESRMYPTGPIPNYDADADGKVDWAEAALGSTRPRFVRVAPGDLDGDGMSDAWEHTFGRWKYPATGLDFRMPDAQANPDNDGLVNLTEYLYDLHPLIVDSDADGTIDTNEVGQGAPGTAPEGPAGAAPVIPWVGNAPGGNPGGQFNPPIPAPIAAGTPVDESFFEYSEPSHPDGEMGVGVGFEALWGRLMYRYATFDYSMSQGGYWGVIDWERSRSGVPSAENSSSPLDLEVGTQWDQWLPHHQGLQAQSENRWSYSSPLPFGVIPQTGVYTSNESWDSELIKLRVTFEEPATRWYYYYYNKIKIKLLDGVGVSRQNLGLEHFVVKPGETKSEQIVELQPRSGSLLDDGEVERIVLEPVQETGAGQIGFRISASDAAGPSYRKIGLNGMPMADSKPQVKDESGEAPEETFVDAFTRQLSHAVTDVYSSVDSSLLALSVRRSAKEQIWNLGNGLRPAELPDAPFGPGWSSNLCASVRIEEDYMKAVVTDEQGNATVFFRTLRDPEGELYDHHVWTHSREEKKNAKTAQDTLETLYDVNNVVTGFVHRKKYGTVCTYEMSLLFQGMPINREVGGYAYFDTYSYARLTKVEDRWGNELLYSYPSDTTLIPDKIHDPDRPNQVVTITQNNGVVTAVRGPSGENIQYGYSTQNTGDDLVRYLSSVVRGGQTVSYQYETEIEPIPAIDLDADGPPDPQHRHFSLTRITDERGGEYKFEYEFNHGNKYLEVSGDGFASRSQLGMPRLVKKVTLPDNSVTNFGGIRQLVCQSDATLGAVSMQTQVSGPCGNYTYTFTQPDVFVPLAQDPQRNPDPFSRHVTVFFSRMEIQTPAGSEVYNFDFDHGMALSSATDLSGNTTTFHYGNVGANGLGWDDPIQQVNALGKSRYFTYDDDTRVMKSMTDERGTLTSYTIQAGTGLRTKETISKGVSTLKVTDFDYGAGGFAGFLAKTTVQSTTATGGDLITEYTPDANGRVQKEAVTAGGGVELVTSYVYTGNGSKRSVTDPRGQSISFLYHPQSLRVVKATNADSTYRQFSYDAHGNMVSERAESGLTTTHEYDSLNRRRKSTSMVDGLNLVRETTYTALNLPHTETDPRGTVTTHTYDGIGRRLTTTVGSGGDAQTTTYTYGTNSGGSVFDVSGFKPTTITDPRGKVTTITYDDLYRPTIKQMPEGNTVTTTYDDTGNPEEVKDALNRITKTTFDGLNRPTKVEYPDATTRHSFYTPSGLVWKVVDELGRETLTQYDRAGRAVEVTLPEVNGVSPVTKTAYDANGNVIAVQDPLGNIVTTVYDNRNRPTKVTSPYIWDALAGQWSRPEVNTTYDAGGNVLTVTDPLGKVTTKTYNNAGWMLTVRNALNQISTMTYDRNGNVKTVTDALNRVVTNTYDIHNRLIETEDAEEQITTFGYDKNGNRTSVTDPRGKVTTFTYDDLNRLLKETFQEGVWTERHYDAVRETSREDSAGREFTFGYDLRDRLTTTTWTVGGSPVVRTRVYDTAGRLTDVTETGRPEATVGYTYDVLDRVATETSQGLTHTYTYDLGGRRTGSALGTGKTIATTYDSQGKPLTVTEGGRTTVYHYDLASRAVAQTQPNGLWQYNSYDDLGRLESRQTYTSADALQAQFLWTYDVVGNVTVQSERWPGEGTRGAGWRSTVMVYDATNRLTGEAMAQPGSPVVTTGYAYDTGSNRSVKLVSTDGSLTTQTLYTYNNFNQLTGWTEEDGQAVVTRTATLTYDLAGNRDTQTLTVTGQAAETTTYHWDAENRLEGVTLPNADEHEYGYDYRTRRISRVENGIGTAIVFSGGLSVAEYESQGITPTVEYLRGPDMGGGVGGMLYSLRNGGTEAKYAMSNGRGDVVAQSNDTGALTWTASYEAYGKRPVETGTNLDRQRANTKEEDPTGLLNEGFRYRDIETGVWLSRDPAGFVDGPNLYAYVQQNPWTKFDPDGLFWAFAVDAAFAAWDIGQFAAGNISQAEYSQRMAITGASVLLNFASGGGFTGGGLVAQVGGRAALKVALSPATRGAVSGLIQTASHIEDFAKARIALNAQSDHGSDDLSNSGNEGSSSPSSTSSGDATQSKLELKFHFKLEATATKKTPLPTLKETPFGPKVADEVPKNGVPRNWTKEDIADAIVDYEASIVSRKADVEAFDAAGKGSTTQRKAHTSRITKEENFLESLKKAAENRK